MEERRLATTEHLISELATIKQVGLDTRDKLDSLVERVGMQNGRVGKLEKWQASLIGATAVLTVLVIPVALRFMSIWFDTLMKVQ